MKISIIIPVFNVEQYIKHCLLSALNQTYSDIECILVDDATPDKSMEIAAALVENHPRREAVKTVHHPENRGLSAARNTGVKVATGDYLFFLDSDDTLLPYSLEILAMLVQDQTADFVIGEIHVIGNKRNAYPPLLLEDGFYQGNNLIFNAFLNKQWYEMAWNKLIRRDFFIKNQLWFEEGILHEDNLWSFQLAAVAQTMAVSLSQTYVYHIRNNSITQKKSKKNLADFYFVLEKIIQWSSEKNLFGTQKSIFVYLEQSRIFFIKMLLKNDFENQYRKEQQNRINRLYQTSVWNRKKRSITVLCKDCILFLYYLSKKIFY
jgi:glycosyltransferase involved in cell wall biosynthesis